MLVVQKDEHQFAPERVALRFRFSLAFEIGHDASCQRRGLADSAGFLIYLADASGYVGSVALLLVRNFGVAEMNWLSFFIITCHVAAVASLGLLIASVFFFALKR